MKHSALCALALALGACVAAPSDKAYEQQRAGYFECREYAQSRAEALPEQSSMQTHQERYDDAFTACMQARARAARR